LRVRRDEPREQREEKQNERARQRAPRGNGIDRVHEGLDETGKRIDRGRI
jgi:hypothetical protein